MSAKKLLFAIFLCSLNIYLTLKVILQSFFSNVCQKTSVCEVPLQLKNVFKWTQRRLNISSIKIFIFTGYFSTVRSTKKLLYIGVNEYLYCYRPFFAVMFMKKTVDSYRVFLENIPNSLTIDWDLSFNYVFILTLMLNLQFYWAV